MLGKTLNHYTIIESLGRGGMGEVYLGDPGCPEGMAEVNRWIRAHI